MLKKELNELVTQTGPGTPMGNLFRRYWLPALMSDQLPGPDCDPVRLELLSEKMLAFRDTQGNLGLIDEFCAHRGVSLWFGRKENNYGTDREAQRQRIFYSGIEGIGIQDASLQESMGTIQDRTQENLVSTDNGIIMTRQRLMKAAKALAEDPNYKLPGLDPQEQKVRSAAVLLKRNLVFKEAAKEALQAAPGKPHSSV